MKDPNNTSLLKTLCPSSDSNKTEERRCWCGGILKDSGHPLYGQCENCNTLVLRQSLTGTDLKEFYGYQKYWHEHQSQVAGHPTIQQRADDDFKDRIPVWHRVLAENHSSPRRVLEIGCAHGGFLHHCRQHGSDVVVGVEVDESTCQFARDHFNLPHVVSGLFPAVQLPVNQFDAICGFDVVEHLLDPVEGLRGVAKILAPDGICFFQTPCHRGEGGDWKQFRPQEHIFLYNEASVRLLFEKCGLEVTRIIPGCFPDDMFIVGRHKVASVKPNRAKTPVRVKVAADYADQHDLTQIDGQSEFASAIRRIFSEGRPERIIETGTYLGEGTTRVIADTLRHLGMSEAQFHSIEINPEHLVRARKNLSREHLAAFVQLHHGVSVPQALLPSLEEIERSTVREIEETDIFVDHREHERAALYFKETNFHGIPDDLLGQILQDFNGRPDFVLLDSGGHMGNIEFNYLIEKLEGPCWIALDDVQHIKHRRSLRQMQADDRFEIVVNSTEKFGFCIAKFQPTTRAFSKPSPAVNCWCGGSLVPSVHELYGCCEKCGTQVLCQHLTPSELKEFYTFDHYWHEHQTKDLNCAPIEQRAADDLKDRVPVWHRLLMQLKPGVQTLLEIGCAHGAFLQYSRERGIPTVMGVEVDESTCEFARNHFGLEHVYSGLFPAVKLPLECFEAIAGFDVLEHLLDPVGALKEVARLLADDGVFLFQLPCYRGEGREWRMFCPINHVFLYTEESLHRLFAFSGLKVDQILPGHFPGDVFVLGHKQREVRKLLWVRTDSIGDAVLASSMLPHLSAKFPTAQISVLCEQRVADLYVACPHVSSIIAFDRSKADDEEHLREVIAEIAQFQPELILNSVYSRDLLSETLTLAFRSSRHVAIESNLDNISEAERDEARLLYDRIIPSPKSKMTELDRHRDFLAGLGIRTPALKPILWTSPEEETLADEFFRQHDLDPSKTIAVFPGAQHAIRVYSGYAEALKELTGYDFLVFGTQAEEPLAEPLMKHAQGRVISLCGRSTLRETAALLRRCRLYVGAESAGAHMACALGVQNVVLLGGGHFGRFMPYSPLTSAVSLPLSCYGCNWRCSYSRPHCIKDVLPDILAEAIRQTLAVSCTKPRLFIQSARDWEGGKNRPAWQHPKQHLPGTEVEIIEVALARESTELTPQAKVHVDQAQTSLDRGDAQTAVAQLELARALCPLHADVLIAIGNLQFQLGNLSACFDALQFAAKLRRRDPLVQVLLATAAARLERIPQFESAIARAFEIDPSFTPAHRLLADFNFEAGRFADAAREYGIVIKQEPKNIVVLLALGKCFSKLNQNDVAAACFNEVLKLDPQNPVATQNLAALAVSEANQPSIPKKDRNASPIQSGFPSLPCPVCNTLSPLKILKKNQPYHQCPDCEIVFTPEIAHELIRTQNNGNSARHDQSQDLIRLQRLTKSLGHRPARLIDFGCGQGESLRCFQSQGIDAVGIDQDTPIQLKDIESGSVEGITMVEVIEHLTSPHTVLEQFNRALKLGGVVYIETSFVDGKDLDSWSYLDPAIGHCTVHSKKSMEHIGRSNGFEIAWLNANVCCLTKTASVTKAVEAASTDPVEIVGEGIPSPVVSVVVSTFNSEAFLRPCLENLTRQTIFNQIEILVVDSGSEQNERAVALEFIQKHQNIRYVRTDRETLYAAWNRGLKIARGRCFANLNTDDSLRDDALEILVAALDKHADCALAYGDTAWTTKPNDTFPSKDIVRTVKYPDYAPIETLFYCITGCLQFWRTESIRKLGGFDASLRCAGDYEATLKMMSAGMNAVHVPEVLSLFYQNTTGLTQASDRAAREHDQVMIKYRNALDIANIFQVSEKPFSLADAWAVLGSYASTSRIPWEKEPIPQMDFAFQCFHKGLESDSENLAAGTNLIVLSHKLKRLVPDEQNLIRRWPKMREWIQRFRMGEGTHLPLVKHALTGPVYRPSEWKQRPTADQLAREPKALRPWICRIDGRHVYLSEDLFPRASGLRYDPKELQAAANRLALLLAELPDFYAHFGGAGDALLLMASFYDKKPEAIVFSHPNSVGATKALFEGFPKLSKIYFLPQHTEPFFHIVLRFAVYELRNCLGAGTTPKFGYDEEWTANLDIEKNYGIHKSPRWAAAMRKNADSRRIALAPKGSLSGMVGSKKNIIPPELWPQVISHVVERGYEPVIFGVPSEAKEYPALPGCADARAESFSGQMQRIGECAGLVGADSWGKTFSALAEIPTIVFEPIKGADLAAWKDCSDWVFIEPWPAIKMVRSFEQFCRAFDSRIAKIRNEPKPEKPVISWEGSFLDYGSLSHINRELTSRLSDKLELTCVGVKNIPVKAASDSSLQQCAKALASESPANVAVTVRHQWPPNWSKPAQGKLVVIQPWEYGALPKAWVEAAGNVDEFWVPSPLVRGMYVNSGIAPEKVRVVPNGVDLKKFHPKTRPLALATRKKFKFLFVGGTIHRKGIDILLECFRKAFTAADDVCLVIKDFGGDSFYRGQTAQEAIRAIQQQPDAPEIVYLTEELSAGQMPSLYAACDCLVLPFRGEGFGMPVLEAMACGLPVVTTAGGATDYFVSPEVGWSIPSQGVLIGNQIGNIPLAKTGWLREPSKPHLAAILKQAAAQPAECRRRGANGRAIAERRFDWNAIAAAVSHRLGELAQSDFTPVTIEANTTDQMEPSATAEAKSDLKEKAVVDSKPAKVHQNNLPLCASFGELSKAREAFGRKDFNAAWNNANAAVESRPFHPEAYLLLAEIALAAGDGNSARKLAQHARDLAPGWKAAKQFLQKPLKGNATPGWLVLPDSINNRQSSIGTRLSVCVITKNEERFIEQCLKSIKPIAHQIIVVDTGSTDHTVGIAKALGAEVHAFTWCDDFSAARNAALEHATGDWILMLDADEELPADQHENLLSDIRKNSAIAYRLPLVNEGQNDGRSFVPRLFRNAPGVHFFGRIHEQVFPSLIPFCKPWGLETLLGTAQLLHHGYTKELVKDRNKIERNLRLLQQAVVERPNDPNLTMNFGLELVRSGELHQGLEKYREAFQLMSAQSPADVVPELREVLLTQITVHLYKDRQHDEIVRVLNSPLAKNGGLTASLHFALGLALFELKQPREAAEQMRQCVAKRNQPALSPINTDILTAAPNHCLALSLAQIGEVAGAKQAFEIALTESGKLENVKFDYAKLLASQDEPVEALHKLHEVVAENPAHFNAWKLGAEIALKQREFLEFACDWTSEAIRALPNDPAIIAFRAEALLLSQQTEHARPLWEKACNCVRPPNALAALILCSAVEAQPIPETRNPDEELAASKAFVGWYQRLVNAGAQETVIRLNSRVDALRTSLPTAARLLDSALAEAK